jgi:5-methylthioadenosine/S-adenosylhomocysteine deaminase
MTELQRCRLNGGTIIAYRDGAHRLLPDGVLVFEGDRIVHVGRDYDGPADRTINAAGKLVIPGFVSTHAHVNVHEGTRLITDVGRRDVMRSGFLNYTPNNGISGPPYVAAALPDETTQFGFAQLIRNGITTVMAFGGGPPAAARAFAEHAGASGIRVYYAPQANSAVNYFDHDGRMREHWDESNGLAELDRQEAFIEENHGRFDGRFQGIAVVRNYALATVDLLRRAKAMADRRGLVLTTHFCEQLFEFHRTVRDYALTPVQLMDREGLLGPNVLLGHCIYIAGHSYTTWTFSSDIDILGRHRAAVAHAPLVMLRRGHAFEGFDSFLDAGVTMSIGTDVAPHNIIEEMRVGALACKLIARNNEVGTSLDFFNAATLGGAKAFGREDIGRLAPGAKADIVIMDFDNLQIGPVYDPIRSLVHFASPDQIETVICDGVTLLEDGELLNYDEAAVVEGGKRSFRNVIDEFPQRHWSKRPVQSEYPLSLETW